MRLRGKNALITGSAGGIGAEIARVFAAEGAEVFICDMKAEDGEHMAATIRSSGGKARFFHLDVTSEESWKSVYRGIAEAGLRVDILVNNAGINIRKPVEEMAAGEWDTMFAVNVRGPFLGIKHAIPLMRAQGGGSIINMSSICGLIGHRYTTEAYTATKGALTLLTKSIATRYAKDNIRSNSLHPSTVDTPFMQELFKDPRRKEERLGEVPLGRLATATDVAKAALYLASDEAAFITGVSLPVDGGLTAWVVSRASGHRHSLMAVARRGVLPDRTPSRGCPAVRPVRRYGMISRLSFPRHHHDTDNDRDDPSHDENDAESAGTAEEVFHLGSGRVEPLIAEDRRHHACRRKNDSTYRTLVRSHGSSIT